MTGACVNAFWIIPHERLVVVLSSEWPDLIVLVEGNVNEAKQASCPLCLCRLHVRDVVSCGEVSACAVLVKRLRCASEVFCDE